MPFIKEIVEFINLSLKGGSLNSEKLQPANYIGLTTVMVRQKPGANPNEPEYLPSYLDIHGKLQTVTVNNTLALQVYHKQITNAYQYEKKSYGKGHKVNSTTEISMVVITNSKIIKAQKDEVEQLIVFGLPQKLSAAVTSDLAIMQSKITPLASNMNQVEVFRQEFPNSDYFLNEEVSMFILRYKVELQFSQACMEKCLC